MAHSTIQALGFYVFFDSSKSVHHTQFHGRLKNTVLFRRFHCLQGIRKVRGTTLIGCKIRKIGPSELKF